MKTRTNLNTQIDTTVFANTEGLVDAQKENTLLKEMVDSGVNKMTDAPLDDKYYCLKNQGIVEFPVDEDYVSNALRAINIDVVTLFNDANPLPTYGITGDSGSSIIGDNIATYVITGAANGRLENGSQIVSNGNYVCVTSSSSGSKSSGVYLVTEEGSSTEPFVLTYAGAPYFVSIDGEDSPTFGRYINVTYKTDGDYIYSQYVSLMLI